MPTYRVDDMTCDHCASTITRAVLATDPGATVTIDLATRRVAIEPRFADAQVLTTAIAEAGYSPMPVPVPVPVAVAAPVPVVAPRQPAGAPRAGGGCCCGTRPSGGAA